MVVGSVCGVGVVSNPCTAVCLQLTLTIPSCLLCCCCYCCSVAGSATATTAVWRPVCPPSLSTSALRPVSVCLPHWLYHGKLLTFGLYRLPWNDAVYASCLRSLWTVVGVKCSFISRQTAHRGSQVQPAWATSCPHPSMGCTSCMHT